jgi:phage terminase large subunit GpA-like protein
MSRDPAHLKHRHAKASLETAEAFVMSETVVFTPGERRVFRRKERITTSQWAERHRVVTNGPMTGRWRNEVTPYLRGPMDTICEPFVRRIILMFAPQTGKTQVGFNFLLHMIDQDPGPSMYVGPDEKVTRRIARRRIIPMFRATQRIAELLSPGVSDTTTLAVKFQNGADFLLTWATSAAEISSESIKYLLRDELDKFPDFSGKEADPLALTEIRTNAYPYTKKIIDMSTPADESGYIGRVVETEADELRRYHVRCPLCQATQVMHFGQFAWPKACHDPREIVRKRLAEYQCEACGMLWDDHKRDLAVRSGFWQAENPVDRPQVVAFHLPSWYSPFVSLSSVVAAYLRGLEDPSKLMIYVTQHKAEVWKETVLPKKESGVLERKTSLPGGVVPSAAIALTAGIDVQKEGFWFVVRAWAEDLTSWLVQYGYLMSFSDVETLLYQTRYPIEGGGATMGIWRAGMDTGGGLTDDNEWTRTEEIYQWIRRQQPGRVYGTKGATHRQLQRIRVTMIDKLPRSNKPIPGGLELRLLDTDQFKGLLHWRLERKEGETQRFFLHGDTGIDYAKQLLAEELCRDRRGKVYWKKIRKDNHMIDCECIAAACADSEWLPSLKMLAAWLKDKKTPGGQAHAKRRTISGGVD